MGTTGRDRYLMRGASKEAESFRKALETNHIRIWLRGEKGDGEALSLQCWYSELLAQRSTVGHGGCIK